jgi:Zn-dependent protease with chaperone function
MILTQPGESRQEFLQGFRRIGTTGGLAIGSSTLIVAVISLVSGIGLEGIVTGRGGAYSFLILGLLFTVTLLGFVYGRLRERPYFTQVILEADLRASSIVGREHFVQVLSKIDSFHLKDVEKAKTGHSRFNFRPSITDRISNLQASPPQRPVSPTLPSQERAANWLTLKRLLYLTILPVVIFYIVLAVLAADGFNIEIPVPIALAMVALLALGIVEGIILYFRFLRKAFSRSLA